MSVKEKILLSLVSLHLLIMVLSANRFPFGILGSVGDAIQIYGMYSGAGNTYSFFAPEVGLGYRAEFDVYDQNNKLLAIDELHRAATREGNLRVANIIELISRRIDETLTRQLLGASLSGKLFARYPTATKIILRVEALDVPTMQEYREGVRYGWEPLYTAQFGYRKRLTP